MVTNVINKAKGTMLKAEIKHEFNQTCLDIKSKQNMIA
jgi:hypothetical protein